MGPGDSKLLCGPTTIIEGKERCDIYPGQQGVQRYVQKVSQGFGLDPWLMGSVPLAVLQVLKFSSTVIQHDRALPWDLIKLLS